MKKNAAFLPPVLLAAMAGASSAWAAGGHHAVDDAGVLEPGKCKVDSWYERSSAPGRLLHLALGCGVGPFEVAASTDPQRQAGTSTADHGLQVKWATPVAQRLSVGLSAAAAWQAHARPRYQGTTASALLSWTPVDTIGLHANLGRDFVHRGPDGNGGGAGIDWTPGGGAWTVVAERFREDGGHFARAGLRWTPAEGWVVDVSRAVRLRGAGDSSWTIGLTREFDR